RYRVAWAQRMSILKVRDGQIEYHAQGDGGLDLLLIPGGVVADAFKPLVSELTRAPSNPFRIFDFHRRGYGGSSRVTPPSSIEDQARDCLALMDSLGLKRVHIVGHSLSGLIALQLAIDAPERVSTLALIEPSLIAFTPSAPQSGQALSKIGALYQSGNKVGALDAFMQGVSAHDYRKMMDKVLAVGWFEQGVKDIDTFFQIDLPAVRAWRFSGSDEVNQPVLSIYGMEKRWDESVATGAEFDQGLHSWFPQTESLAIRGSYHWPHVTNAVEVAMGLTDFVIRNTS